MDRYSDALDAQIEYARFWSSVEGERLFKKLTDFSKEQKISDWEAGALKSFTTSPLIHGETFYWSPPICELIFTTAESIPTSWTLRSDSLITPCGFSWLGTPFNMTGFRPIYAIGWVPFVYRKNRIEVAPYPYNPILEGGLAISFFSKVQGVQKAVPLTVLLWDIDTHLTHPRHDEEAIKKMSVFATMMTFLQQRILVPSKFYADRVSRRRAERANVRPPSNEVQVVMFRRVERRTGEGEHRRVEWTCHWMVRPHWRNQWYPSKKHYRPIPIAAYIKGPEDRPLRHTERVFAVVR